MSILHTRTSPPPHTHSLSPKHNLSLLHKHIRAYAPVHPRAHSLAHPSTHPSPPLGPLPSHLPLDVRIEDLGPPDRIIAGFAPELYGRPLDEGDVLEQAVVTRGGLSYYQWAVKPHR